MQRQIRVWGFPPDALRELPEGLEPVDTIEPSSETPIVVHSDALERFRARVDEMPEMPDAVLYLRRGERMPTGAGGYFDATVEEGDWEKLRELLDCPRGFEMAEMADELPAEFVEQIDRPVGELDAATFPLPEDVRDHLVTCSACREAFNRSLNTRMWVRRTMVCPPVEMLLRHVRGESVPAVERHLERCRVCQAQVHVLRRVAARSWLKVALRKTAQLGEALEDRVSRLETLLAVAFTRAGFSPMPVTRQPQPRDMLEIRTRAEEDAVQREPVRVADVDNERGLSLSWSQERDAFWVGDLQEKDRPVIEKFSVELREGDEVLWAGTSDEGKVNIPRIELERAIRTGAELVIRESGG